LALALALLCWVQLYWTLVLETKVVLGWPTDGTVVTCGTAVTASSIMPSASFCLVHAIAFFFPPNSRMISVKPTYTHSTRGDERRCVDF
jgi:hypothetical protein